MENRWIRDALRVAQKSTHVMFRMGAVIVRGGAVVSRAANQPRPWRENNRGKHAEERALRPHNDYRGATLYVARIGGSMSRPCEGCWEQIRKRGIAKVVWVDWDGSIVTERIR